VINAGKRAVLFEHCQNSVNVPTNPLITLQKGRIDGINSVSQETASWHGQDDRAVFSLEIF